MQRSVLLVFFALALSIRAAPYFSTRIVVPGRIQAEDYDRGGAGVAYFDTDSANNGGAYRPAEAVDVQPSTDGTFNVGWTQPGEWLKYSINVVISGVHRFDLRIAAGQVVGPIQLSLNGAIIGQVDVPNTGDWGMWQTVSLANVQLSVGLAELTITFTGNAVIGGGPNLNWIDVVPNDFIAAPPKEYPSSLDGAFFDQAFVSGLTAPTDMAFAPDGRIFISEKQGTIRVWRNGGLLPVPCISLIDEVQNAGDKGLLSIALHPFFSTNSWIYLLYAVDPIYGQPDETEFTPVLHRLVRYTLDGDVVDTASRLILVGKSLADGLTSCASTHTGGKMRFAPDNTLMLSFGDGSHYEFMDLGNDAACRSGGFVTNEQDIGAFRAQSLGALQGKVLRIDPDTGLGVPSNPWYDVSKPIQSRIWALGFRNPFRWSFKPTNDGSIVLLVGDVGNGDSEDVTVTYMGDNAGWPCYEGRIPAPGYFAAKPDFCKDVGTLAGNQRWPLLEFTHSDAAKSYPTGYLGNAITSVATYMGQSYPPVYQGAVFIADHSRGWLGSFFLDFNKQQHLGNVMFNPNAVSAVTIESSPAVYNFDLFYLNVNAGQLRRIAFGNAPPVANAASSPSSGNFPLTVRFTADGSFDAQGRTIAIAWDFGDGTVSSEPNPVHTYTSAGNFIARLTVTAGSQVALSSVRVNTRAPRPSVRVSQPKPFTTYTPNSNVQFTADLSANAAAVTLSWELQLVHNAHYHPQTAVSTDLAPAWQLEGNTPDGQRISYRVIATATNSEGYSVTDFVSVVPEGSPNGVPLAAFILSKSAGTAPLQVTVDSLGSADPDGDLLFYTWNWGDGSLEAQGTDARHIYAYGGEYTIILTVMDNYGAKSSATRNVTVSGPLPPASAASTTNYPTTSPTVTQTTQLITVVPVSAATLVVDVLTLDTARTIEGDLYIRKALHISTSAKNNVPLLFISGNLVIAPEAHLNVSLFDTPADGQLYVIAQAFSIQGAFATAFVSSPANNSCTSISGNPEVLSNKVAVLFRVEGLCTSKKKHHPWLIGLVIALIVVSVSVVVLTACLAKSVSLREKLKSFLGAAK